MRAVNRSSLIRLSAIAGAVLAMQLTVPRPARAGQQLEPPTRNAVLEDARAQKGNESVQPRRSLVERALYWYDNQYVLNRVFGGWNGFRFAGGDFPTGAGTKYGLGYRREFGANSSAPDPKRPNRLELDATASQTTLGYAKGVATFTVRNIGGRDMTLKVRGESYKYPQEDFFGFGNDSQQSDRTNFSQQQSEVGAEFEWKAPRFVEISSGLAYLSPMIESGTDPRFPSTEERFNPVTVPGYLHQPDFIRSDISAAFEWRDNPLHPHTGGRYSLKVSDYRDRDLDAFTFRQFEIETQQYLPLLSRQRVLAVAASASLTDSSAGQNVPFYYQPTLGGGRTLRGFRESRFRDLNSLQLTAEYRWEAWWALDGAIFVDAGTVAPTRQALRLRDLDVSYGIGFRLHSNSAFVARLDLAYSREGFIPLLRFDHVF